VLEGEYAGDRVVFPNRAQPKVVFAGRFIPEKRVPALVRAFAVALQQEPQLRLVLYGDGPEREMVLGLVQELGLEGVVEAPGFVDTAEVQRAFKEALCVVQPSRREGYGLIVVEASALGTPSVVISGEDNAAVELVEDGVNGVVAAAVSPDVLAAAILRVWQEGPDLRATTVNWYRQHEVRLSLRNSLETVVNTYRRTQEKSVR
jgi:glycosyltransferase involved in cell wall biosynthesis